MLVPAVRNDFAIPVVDSEVRLVSQAKIHREVWAGLPIVLNESRERVEDVVGPESRILLETRRQPEHPLRPSIARPCAAEIERSAVGIKNLMPVCVTECDFDAQPDRMRSSGKRERIADFMREWNHIKVRVPARAEVTGKRA